MVMELRKPAPLLDVPTLRSGRWNLNDAKSESFTMIVVYRGLHCPLCKKYLAELVQKLPQFAKLGVTVFAVSAETRERAERARVEWELEPLEIGYQLPIAMARTWDLYISRARNEQQPPEFAEPGLFLVRPDGMLFYAATNSGPFGRPPLDEMLLAIDYINRQAAAAA